MSSSPLNWRVCSRCRSSYISGSAFSRLACCASKEVEPLCTQRERRERKSSSSRDPAEAGQRRESGREGGVRREAMAVDRMSHNSTARASLPCLLALLVLGACERVPLASSHRWRTDRAQSGAAKAGRTQAEEKRFVKDKTGGRY